MVSDVAREVERSPSQVALAWVRQQPGVIVPILGARTAAQLEDNLAALDLRLSEAHMARLAEASKAKWEKVKPFRQPILTPITAASEFYPAEDYHQDYYKKNPVQYRFYVTGCGRYARLDQLWGALRKH